MTYRWQKWCWIFRSVKVGEQRLCVLDYGFERFEAAPLSSSMCSSTEIGSMRLPSSSIEHVQSRGRVLTEKMKELIPRQMFDVRFRLPWVARS
ncbi:MAG: hypothetical protein CM15mP84_06760 [Cellvibrionales bacterium]|nr:MAG: hypothetical protein CM15mP84_06760 [Cellvibrionales bacterium]